MSESGETRRDKSHLEVARGAGIAGAGVLWEIGVRLASILLVPRILGAANYGVFGFAMRVAEIGRRVSSAGLYDGVMRYVAIHESRKDWARLRGAIFFASKIILGLGLLLALVILLFAPWIAVNSFQGGSGGGAGPEEIEGVIRAVAIAAPLVAFLTLLVRALRGMRRVGAATAVFSIFLPTARLALVLGLFALGFGMIGVGWAVVVSSFAACLLAIRALHQAIPLWGKDTPAIVEKKEFLSFSIPLVGVDIFSFLALNADFFILAWYASQEDAGIYNAVIRLMLILTLPLTLVQTLLTPMSASLSGEGRLDELRSLYRTATRWIFTSMVPIVLVVLLFSDVFLGVVGADYMEGGDSLALLAATLLLAGFANPAGYAVTMSGRSGITLLNSVLCFLTTVGVALWLIPEFGIFGAAGARAASLLVNNALTLVQGKWILGLNPFSLALLKPILAGAVACSAGWWALDSDWLGQSPLDALMGSVAVAGIFLGVLLALGLGAEDKEVLAAARNSIRRRLGRGGKP